jgi:succinoglycan biosynthesis transport protein ExoP
VTLDGLSPAAPDASGANYIQAIRNHWLAMAALVVVAVAAAVAYSAQSGKRYDAEAVLFVTPLPSGDDALTSVGVFREVGSGAATSVYALGRILSTPNVVDEVKVRLGEPQATRSEILDLVTINPVQQSATVSIVASSRTPERAAEIANTFADVVVAKRGTQIQRELVAARKRLRARLGSALPSEALAIQSQLAELDSFTDTGDPTLRILARAVPPEAPASAGQVLIIVIAILAALLVGVAGAFLLEMLLPRVRRDDAALQRVPILAQVPRARGRAVRGYLNGSGTLPGDLWEAYRILRASLSSSSSRTVLVTSAIQGEGKTMTSVNLAIALAASGQRVVLVDGDLRRPMVARAFRISPTAGGFAELLFERAKPDDVLVAAPGYGDRLRLLLAGSERPLDLLERRRIQSMLDRLRSEADVIVVDSPALTEFADAIALADAVDTVLVAVRLGHSRRDKLAEVERRLAQHRIIPAGFVVTVRGRSRREGLTGGPEGRVESPIGVDGNGGAQLRSSVRVP